MILAMDALKLFFDCDKGDTSFYRGFYDGDDLPDATHQAGQFTNDKTVFGTQLAQ